MKKKLNLKISNFKSFKYFKYKNVGNKITGIVLNLTKIEKIEKIKIRKKYSFFLVLVTFSEKRKK